MILQGLVAFIDNHQTLQCYRYIEEMAEWKPFLRHLPVHRNTTLSGCFDSDSRSMIFFQSEFGYRRGLVISMTGDLSLDFCELPLMSTSPTPIIHSAFTSQGMIPHLFCIHWGEIHTLKLDSADKRWQGTKQNIGP